MKIQLDHINMTVTNLEQTQQWYSSLFAFECVESGVRRQENRTVRWAIIKKDETMLCLYEYPDKGLPGQRPFSHHQVSHFGIRFENLDVALWERLLKEYKIEVEYGGAVDYPHSKSWYITDPSGHEIEVSYWPRGVQFGL